MAVERSLASTTVVVDAVVVSLDMAKSAADVVDTAPVCCSSRARGAVVSVTTGGGWVTPLRVSTASDASVEAPRAVRCTPSPLSSPVLPSAMAAQLAYATFDLFAASLAMTLLTPVWNVLVSARPTRTTRGPGPIESRI